MDVFLMNDAPCLRSTCWWLLLHSTFPHKNGQDLRLKILISTAKYYEQKHTCTKYIQRGYSAYTTTTTI